MKKTVKTFFKIFTIELVHNQYSNQIQSKYDFNTSAIIERRQKFYSVMIWSEICSTGNTPPGYVDEAPKINHKTYR